MCTGSFRRDRFGVVDDLSDIKLFQIHIWIRFLQLVEGTAELFGDLITIITLLASVLSHDNHSRCDRGSG